MKTARGFSLFEVVALVALVVIVGAVGYLGYTNFIAKPAPKADVATVGTASESDSEPVTVKSTSDLDKLSTELDSMSIEDSDSGQYDTAAESF